MKYDKIYVQGVTTTVMFDFCLYDLSSCIIAAEPLLLIHLRDCFRQDKKVSNRLIGLGEEGKKRA
jgi:hypothetical protein